MKKIKTIFEGLGGLSKFEKLIKILYIFYIFAISIKCLINPEQISNTGIRCLSFLLILSVITELILLKKIKELSQSDNSTKVDINEQK